MADVESGFLGNDARFAELVQWLDGDVKQFGTLCQECVCVVTGGAGVGKSHGIVQAIARVDKDVRIINAIETINSNDFKEFLHKQTTCNILDQFDNSHARRGIVIFIDDIETLLAADRSFINKFNLLLTSKNNKPVRIVASCSIYDVKAVTKNMLYDKIITLEKPSPADIEQFLLKNEAVVAADGFDAGEGAAKEKVSKISKIAVECDGNLSTAINRLGMYLKTSVNKTDIYPEVAKIYNIHDRKQLFTILEQDPWLHPLRFHENLIFEFGLRKGSKLAKEQMNIKILQGLCEWDQLMSHTKGGDMTEALEHACSTMLQLTSLPKIKNAAPSMDEFTRMFNYLSLRKKNLINLYEGGFPWYMIGSSYKKVNDAKVRKEVKNAKSKAASALARQKKLSTS